MADLVITAANVLKGTDAVYETGIAGDGVTAGQSVYKDTSDNNRWKKAKCDSTAALAGSGGLGITLHAASAGQPLVVQTSGSLNPGAALTPGQIYVVSTNAGGIAPFVDLNTNHYVSVVGYGYTADILRMVNLVTGVQAGADL